MGSSLTRTREEVKGSQGLTLHSLFGIVPSLSPLLLLRLTEFTFPNIELGRLWGRG